MSFWLDWVGLPWRLGADPRDGKGACCFRTAQAAREALLLPWPADEMARWYELAQAGAWELLREDWKTMTYMEEGPTRAGQLVKFDRDDGGFGLGVMASETALITVPEHRRLIVLPAKMVSARPRYELR